MEAIRAPSVQADTVVALADRVVSDDGPTEKECPMRAEETVAMGSGALRDDMAGNANFIENVVTSLVTLKGDNRISTMDNRLEAMIKGLFNQVIEEKLISVKSKHRVLRKIEDETLSPRHGPSMTEPMLDNQDFMAPMATKTEKETVKAVQFESNRECRHQTFVDAGYSTGTPSSSSN